MMESSLNTGWLNLSISRTLRSKKWQLCAARSFNPLLLLLFLLMMIKLNLRAPPLFYLFGDSSIVSCPTDGLDSLI